MEVMVSFTPGGALVVIEQEAKLVCTSRKEKSVFLLPGFEPRLVHPLAWPVY